MRFQTRQRLQVQMKSQGLYSLDPFSIFSFLSAFKLASDTNGVVERAVLWRLHFFMKCTAVAALNAGVALQFKSHNCQNEGAVKSNWRAVRYLLETYWTDNVITETDAHMTPFTQPSNN